MKSGSCNIKIAALIITLVILHTSKGMAEPVVIVDTGQTQSLAAYLPAVNPPVQTAFQASTTANPNAERLPILAHSLPVITPELTPGKVAPKTLSIPYLERPVFIVGADAVSLQWLQQHHERLNTLHAMGLVVNVATAAQWAQLKQQAAPLELAALSGSELAQQFGLRHYPVLISSARIEQ